MTSEWIQRARSIGPVLREHVDRHDVDGTFADEAYALLKEQGLFKSMVPSELGGGGAGIRDIGEFIRNLAHYDSSAALAYSMHSHLVAATVWRYKHGQPGEALLKKIVDAGIVLVSTGASDWLESNGTMTKVEGGYRYTSKKPFASGSPMGTVMITSGRYDDPAEGPLVLHFSLPLTTEGVTIGNDWDTLGMRGTGSHTVDIDGAFIPDASIALRRPSGPWHPAFNVIATIALPIVMSAYLGVAEHAAGLALESAKKRRNDVDVQYLAGEMGNELFVSRALWDALIENAKEYEFQPELDVAIRALQGKTKCADAMIRTVEKAMELGGGSAYFRKAGIERLLRDVRAAPYHPLQAKRQHRFTGRAALGLDPVETRG